MAGTITASIVKNDTTSPPAFQNSAGTEIGTLCRAWVNFNGSGTVAIRASFNVSSITDNGTGDYTVNFTTAMPDANYSGVCSAQRTVTDNGFVNGIATGVSAFRIRTAGSTGTSVDYDAVNVAIFR